MISQLTDQDLETALDGLPPELRMVLLLADLEHFSYKETADILDIPVSTVRGRLYRARRRIEGILSRIIEANASVGHRDVSVQAAVATVSQLTPDLLHHLKQNSADLANLAPRVFEHLLRPA